MITKVKTKMQTYSVSEELNQFFGAPGTESRRKAEEQAWEEYNAQILHNLPISTSIGADSPYPIL